MKVQDIIGNLVETAVIVSRTDAKGTITYVNKRFCDVSGYSASEAIGQNHRIVNSGVHAKAFWADMYRKTVREREIWNAVVTNKAKDGRFYYVDTFIQADFDFHGRLEGFTSIRVDVTDLMKVNEKLNRLVSSQTAYVLRTDMQGRHTYWNQKFEEEFGWVYQGDMLHGDSLLSICESHHGAAYDAVTECIAAPGKIVKVELDKPHRDGSKRTTLWEFVCLTDSAGNPFEVQCMGIDITERVSAERKTMEVMRELNRKNSYLEHAAKILRHDMHSGINTYLPRGLSSLERRLTPEVISTLKLEAPLRLLKDGLLHTQKVYLGVKEFTNLVKSGATLETHACDLDEILNKYLAVTAYKEQVVIGQLPRADVNESLFCTAIDNLIRNGLKYNDSPTKSVHVFMLDDNTLVVQDNGRGMTQEEFARYSSNPYTRKEGQAEEGTGLGLSIALAILQEHKFTVKAQKMEIGTQMQVRLK